MTVDVTVHTEDPCPPLWAADGHGQILRAHAGAIARSAVAATYTKGKARHVASDLSTDTCVPPVSNLDASADASHTKLLRSIEVLVGCQAARLAAVEQTMAQWSAHSTAAANCNAKVVAVDAAHRVVGADVPPRCPVPPTPICRRPSQPVSDKHHVGMPCGSIAVSGSELDASADASHDMLVQTIGFIVGCLAARLAAVELTMAKCSAYSTVAMDYNTKVVALNAHIRVAGATAAQCDVPSESTFGGIFAQAEPINKYADKHEAFKTASTVHEIDTVAILAELSVAEDSQIPNLTANLRRFLEKASSPHRPQRWGLLQDRCGLFKGNMDYADGHATLNTALVAQEIHSDAMLAELSTAEVSHLQYADKYVTLKAVLTAYVIHTVVILAELSTAEVSQIPNMTADLLRFLANTISPHKQYADRYEAIKTALIAQAIHTVVILAILATAEVSQNPDLTEDMRRLLDKAVSTQRPQCWGWSQLQCGLGSFGCHDIGGNGRYGGITGGSGGTRSLPASPLALPPELTFASNFVQADPDMKCADEYVSLKAMLIAYENRTVAIQAGLSTAKASQTLDLAAEFRRYLEEITSPHHPQRWGCSHDQ